MMFQRKPKCSMLAWALTLTFVARSWTSPCLSQSLDAQPWPNHSAPDPSISQASTGAIHGTVVDQSGAVVSGARVSLTCPNPSRTQSAVSGGDGQFYFTAVDSGPFQLTIAASGFQAQTSSGVLHPGETYTVPQIALAVATRVAEVEVTLTRTEEAEKEIKMEEKQRVLGVVPNFYVTYVPDALPLNSRQKFEIAWKTTIDPVTLVIVGAAAGVEQAQNHFNGYGQGAQGYGKRFGANYADAAAGTFVGGAVLPSLLKQDPRYFYKGTGSKLYRFSYAIASSFICKGDNGRWQPNYSNVLGSLAAGGISNLYYPRQNRNGAGLTFENAALGLIATSASNIVEEFFIRKITPKIPKTAPPQP